jgi:deoxyribose-phosphate aldolase
VSVELRRLAERIARELAAGDLRHGAEKGGAQPAGGPPRIQSDEAGAAGHRRAIATGGESLPSASGAATDAFTSTGVARIADYIDHTLLKAEATRAEIDTLCDEARENQFATVCINPVWVAHCAARLRGSGVGVATVIGFPLGASDSETKAFEAGLAVRHGATELDMVAAIGHIKSGDWHHVFDDIDAVVRAAPDTPVKVIIESAALTPVEIIRASALAREAGALFVKTSTGFHSAGGATAEAVALMRLVVGDTLGVKASGGVRDCPTALRMIASGATRIGTSSGVAMVKCLGPGPMPLRDLLSIASDHATHCTTGACVPQRTDAY